MSVYDQPRRPHLRDFVRDQTVRVRELEQAAPDVPISGVILDPSLGFADTLATYWHFPVDADYAGSHLIDAKVWLSVAGSGLTVVEVTNERTGDLLTTLTIPSGQRVSNAAVIDTTVDLVLDNDFIRLTPTGTPTGSLGFGFSFRFGFA